MKFKLKNKKRNWFNIVAIVILAFSITLAFTSSFFMQSLSNEKSANAVVKNEFNSSKKRSSKIDKYINTIDKDNLIEEIDIKGEITSVLTFIDGQYKSSIFDYETGNSLTITDLLKEDSKQDFEEKKNELIYLKYPKFIADVISVDNGKNTYFFRDNELIIYFYDYKIDPMPKEDLFLVVNYNEIKDYLNIVVDLDKYYTNEDGSIINASKKLVAITFDDGPGPYTNRLVDILNDNKAHATFFMIGKNLEKYPNTILNVYNNGNEIGYHSYAHTNFKRQDLATIKNEFAISNETLKSITGKTFTLVRPPYGDITTEIKNALDASFIFWNVDTEDWRHKEIDYLLDYTLDTINAGDIVLFHDIHESSIDAIEKILPYLYVEGYQVVTVSELAKEYNTTLEPHKVYRHFK